jgi:hypothetical protein
MIVFSCLAVWLFGCFVLAVLFVCLFVSIQCALIVNQQALTLLPMPPLLCRDP